MGPQAFDGVDVSIWLCPRLDIPKSILVVFINYGLSFSPATRMATDASSMVKDVDAFLIGPHCYNSSCHAPWNGVLIAIEADAELMGDLQAFDLIGVERLTQGPEVLFFLIKQKLGDFPCGGMNAFVGELILPVDCLLI